MKFKNFPHSTAFGIHLQSPVSIHFCISHHQKKNSGLEEKLEISLQGLPVYNYWQSCICLSFHLSIWQHGDGSWQGRSIQWFLNTSTVFSILFLLWPIEGSRVLLLIWAKSSVSPHKNSHKSLLINICLTFFSSFVCFQYISSKIRTLILYLHIIIKMFPFFVDGGHVEEVVFRWKNGMFSRLTI